MRSLIGKRRAGSVAPVVAISLVSITGAVALAIDVGRIAVARLECQSAADVAAMAGARTLNGIMPQDLDSATNNARTAAAKYTVMGQPITDSDVTVEHGTYRYDQTALAFSPQYTLQAGENYNLTKVTISKSTPTTFAKVFGFSAFNVTTTATAAHRPRDICIVLDYSGSMNNESDLWNNEGYLDDGTSAGNNPNNTSNNQETVYPKFGHYSKEKKYSDNKNYANLLCPAADSGSALSGDPRIGKCNVTVPALGVPAMVNDFYSNARGATAAGAFTAVADSALDSYNRAGGDAYLWKKSSTTVFAATLAEALGSTSKNSSFETNGYKSITTQTFSGYTQGPRYWGKTFFIWPPDPKTDWRQTFFSTKNNTKLWDSTGNWRDPSGNYTINYKAILSWIKNSGANPFPSQLRSGNILYYDQIPDDVASSAYTHTNLNSAISDSNQRFWKEYIDYVVGVWRDPYGSVEHPGSPAMSYGPDYTFGTIKISAPPSGSGAAYMVYDDNPERPRHRLWFGPMTMVQFMSDTGILPGTAHDISMYPMKIGIGQALKDIQNNHPNDQVSMILFNRPLYQGGASGTGSFNLAQYSLASDVQPMLDSLWLPPNSSTSDVRPWDANGAQTPRAFGDWTANTASSYGFLLAYNQLSASKTLKSLDDSTPGVGGRGRVGAQRLVIYETDGMANQGSTPANGFASGSYYDSYYRIQPGQTLNSAGYSEQALLQVIQNICNDKTGNPVAGSGIVPYSPNQNYPGFGASGKPVTVHCLAFGGIFETPSSTLTSSVNLLQKISQIGGTTFPSSAADSTNGFKWCIGSIEQRQSRLVQAFQTILNLRPVPITLVR